MSLRTAARHRALNFSTARRLPRLLAGIVSAALIAAGLVVGLGGIAANATSVINLSTTSDGSILAGQTTKISLKASNPGTTTSDNLYNLSYTYTLPQYVSYHGGSTSPDTVGEPTIVTITDVPAQVGPPAVAAITHQVLVWSNASDLPFGDSAGFSFTVDVDSAHYPVGSTVTGAAATAYANADPRMLPKFSPTTGAVTSGYTASGTATPAATNVAAIKLTKSEPSPESELMRGVHDQTTVYTLVATETTVAGSTGVTITDDIPAQLEFLGCGGVDNSQFRTAEYSGSGTLSGTPNPGASCLTPSSVTTVQNPGSLTGIFTEVTWSLGTLSAGQVVTIKYAAGIPLRQNTMSWDSSAGAGQGTAPATTGAQGSNLDNNNGSLTRQIAAGSTLTNTALAAGTYQGAVQGTNHNVTSSTTFTNKIMDLSIVKTESTSTFNAGHTVDFSLLLRASEYEDDSAMTIVDTIPNGLCPLVPAGVVPVIDPGAENPTECQVNDTVTNATIQSVEAKADGTWIVTMTPDLTGGILSHNDNLTIMYTAYMRTNYQGDSLAPTVAGDSFQNKVIIDGTSSSITDVSPTDQAVHDDSAATLGSSAPTIQKLILPRPAASGSAVDCSTATGYIDNHTYPATGTLPVFQLGDKICFELIVNYSASTLTRNSQVQDFVPTGTTYQSYAVAASSTVPAGQVSSPDLTDPNSPIFSIGATQPGDSSGDLFVQKGGMLTMFVSAVVSSTSVNTTVDITANLMKYRQESTANTVLALRYQANYGIAPAPTVSLNKTATLKNGAAVTGNSDDVQVQEGDTLTSAITITNTGTSIIGNDFTLDNLTIWDSLPAGITCSNFDSASDSGVCTNPGDSGHPVLTDTTVSTIVWTLPASLIAAGTEQVTYTLHIATGTSVSRSFTNTASVVAFQSINSNGGQTDYYPLGSLNPAHNGDGNTTAANDTAKFHLLDVAVAKTASPEISETNKSSSQVVNGEHVDYTYSVTVPAHSTVFNGVLSDSLPTGLSIPGTATISASLAGTSYTSATIPASWTLGTDGKLTFPATVDNTTSSGVVYSVTVLGALVSPTASGTLTNTGQFTSTSTVNPASTPIATQSHTAAVTVVAPALTFTKTVTPTTASAGQTVTYTLLAGNGSGKPAAWDGVITDCLPAGIAFAAFLTAPTGTTTNSTAGDGTSATGNCAVGATYLTWTLPAHTGILSSATVTITFTGTVASSAAGLHTYSNTALLTASSLDDGQNSSATELVATKTSSAAVVTVNGASVAKTITSTTPTVIGSTVDYKAVVTLPANVNFYNAAVIDTLPSTSGAMQYVSGSAVVSCATAETIPGDCAEATDLPGSSSSYALSPFPTTGTATKIGWLLGSIPSQTYVRTVTITYSMKIMDIVATNRAATEQNSATISWTDQGGTAPTTANSTFAHSATVSNASFTVQGPNMTLTKTVENQASLSATPGANFTYRIVASNDNNASGADAYDAVVTDTIPTGVVVDPASISGTFATTTTGGVITSITWQLGTVAKGTSATTLSYTATLATSTSLTGAALNNSAVVSSYRSLEGAGRTYGPSTAAVAAVTPAFPKVTLGKTITGGSAVAYVGSPLSYALTMTNALTAGTGTATTITPTDVLPANWILVGTPTITMTSGGTAASFAPTSSTITSAVQTLVWSSIANVAPGQVVTINYTAEPTSSATTTPGVGSTVLHTNTFTAVTTDPTGATHSASAASFTTNTATASAHIDKADLSIVKAAGGALVAGQTTTNAWTLTVKNNGTDTAVGPFAITDTPTLPAGVTINSASGTGWSCTTPDPTTGAFTCARSNANDTLASGVSFAVINISVTVAADVVSATTADNTATVSASTFDPATANNSSSKTISVTTAADLKVTKTANGTFTAGSTASWTLGVQNLGSSIARYPITVVDTLPSAGIDPTSAVATGTDWTCGAPTTGATPTITCTYNGPGGTGSGLAIGSTPSITVTANIPSNITASIVNNVSVSSPTTDPVSSNNTATSTTSVTSSTSLAITKTLLTTPFVAGSPATYELVVTNNGTPDARSVVINDPLPTGLTYTSFSAVSGTWACSDNGTGGVSNAHCVLSSTLQGTGGTNVATVRITVATSSALTGGVLNTATVTWANSGTASGSSNGTTTEKADLQLTKTHPTGAVLAGNDVTYTLSVKNAGPSDEPAGVTVTDTLPTGLSYGTVSGTGWTCATPVGQLVTCTSTGVITNGATANDITVVAHIPSSGGPATYTNTADVTGVIDDPDTSNNHATDPTVVTNSAVMSITKIVAGNATTWVAGTDISYVVTVTNSGPSDASSVSVTDTLPAGLSMVSISSTDTAWACSNTTFACTRSAMAPGTSVISVTAHVSSAVPQGTVKTNSAMLQWTDSRPTPSTATATADVTVQAHADLKLVKSPATQNVNAGDDATFTLAASNLGPSDAVGPVVIADVLPIGIRYASNSSGWTCVAATVAATATQEVDCTLGDGTVGIAGGGSAIALSMLTHTDPTLGMVTLTNSATVDSATTDTVPSNNSATATVTFGQSADLTITKTHVGNGQIGSALTFTVTVSNTGPSMAQGVEVTDTLHNGLTWVGYVGSDPAWTCTPGTTDILTGNTPVTCDLTGAVGVGGSSPTLLIQAEVTSAGYPTVDNVASVDASTPDPDVTNNSVTDPVTVDPTVDLSVQKTHLGQLVVGSNADYQISVSNSGPTEDPGGFTIVDALPAGLTYVSYRGTGVTCVNVAGTVTCTFTGVLAVNATQSVILTTTVSQDAYPTVINSVTAASLYTDLATLALTDSDTAAVDAKHLAFTGSNVNMIAWGALVLSLIFGGVGFVFIARRRRRVV